MNPDTYYCPLEHCDWTLTQGVAIPDDATPADTAALEQLRAGMLNDELLGHYQTHSAAEWAMLVGRLQQALQEQLPPAPPLFACFGCYLDRYNAEQKGVPADQLPPVRVAEFVVDGRSLASCHLKLQTAPVVPGRTPGGIILGNGVIAPPMNGG